MRIVAMIPARLGSKRVKKKNLRLLGDKPLIEHIITSASAAKNIDDIYVNSESLEFKSIAKKTGVNFYHRPEHLSSDQALNDDFALDFIQNISCDVLIQLLPTSPFIDTNVIDAFIGRMQSESCDTLISVKKIQIECIFKKKPINFDNMGKTLPSQKLEPIYAYACGIMGWKTDVFVSNMKQYGSAYHGGKGKTDYFELEGESCIDIDTESDFHFAQLAYLKRHDVRLADVINQNQAINA